MDIFKGIGDFFGGLFGQKKKREDEQPQPQQQQSAVSFNSTPKLGDNFANNLSNPTQPQQPKEFAKSSVDLNPVKPVQPVQPQPQVNRDQERQQLANKYRQEETDRYNQGSDHAANFLNDIFSGGKTAQMRENTINQNIQNRVNAEMLRKYGLDDQQVKQNIAQTSQNINKNATAVSDFTKNYNNNVQQTVSAPVSAVKGAANSVVEFVPRVSGTITELGANTIKLFDENNQFANNLIKRVRADREKNIVRKTLNDATGLTDQDNKMAYGLGNSGARMAIDAAMTPVTGGIAPAVVHGVEAHSEMMDHLDNIEARKKAEAAAKSETYTPSSFASRYLASTANAGAQAAIEKLGIDNLTGKIGGRFAKNMVGRAITGALGEAGEEGAQQYAENFTKKLFDNKQDIHEGVAESALMGGIMGGAGKMAFGGMDAVKNPYKSNTSYDPKALYEAERSAVTLPREKITLAEAERQNRGGDLQYTPRRETNISRLDSDQLGFTKDELIGRFVGDTRKRMSERSFNMLQDLRANNPYVTGDGQEIYLSGRGNKKFVNTQAGTDAEFIAKMRSTPRINELIQNSKYSHTSPDTKNHGIAPNGFDYRDVNFKYGGKDFNTTFNVARNNTINRNTLYGATTKENISTPGLRDNPSTKSYADVYDSNITQKDQKVNIYSKDSVNRSGFTNPYAQNNKHTTFANDRDSSSIFGNGFDPRGRNGSVNKDGGFGIEIKHNLNPDNYQLTDNPEPNHELVRLMEETFDRTIGLDTTKQNVVANFYDDPDFESALEAKERWYEDLDPNVEEQIWEDIFKDRGYDVDYESDDEGLLRKKDDYMDYERINEMLKNAADDVQWGHDESNSLAAGPITSRYPRVLDEQIRLANHSNGRSNDYEVRYSEDDLRNKRISSQDMKRDFLDEITRLVEDKRDSLGEFTNIFNEGGLAEGVEYLVDNLPHTEADPNNPYRFTVYGREVYLSRFKGETDAEVIANDATDQILEALTEERDDVDYQNVKYKLPDNNSNLPEVNYTETEGTPIYRGQAQAGRGIIKNQTNFVDSGNYENGAFFTDNLDTAHKYGDNILETRRNNKNTVSVEESDKLQAMAEKRMDEIMRNPKLYDEMDEDEYDLLEQMALGRPEAFAQYTKKPFVETGDKFGESGEVVYFKGIDDAAGIIRFKQKAEAENLARVAKENLQARHQELTGDQSIAFNEWANELERRAQGFFDEKTGKITINDGDLNTLNHELGHKLLTRADNRAELLADIRNTVGDEALNAKYGENYVEQVANMNPEERANLFAEEYLADGFSDYYNGILAGEDSQRLGAKLGIPPRVLATYDRIVEAIKGILGLQQDTLKQFYAQAETGKFAHNYKQNTSVYNESPAFKITQDSRGDLGETDQKTRKFAETVLDTDTPPKDFVKLMHAGDESLKYTPKKNSELWNRATKSVQESPERVFNELENTRVANDETMAKGIALAKHYQAMGDDLKASELYVELAKKATEAGRTVQALNLMRKTTPEGVLMSTMREVESYNDKMKDKPNKQINITPEQRAEFLGKLREAYAMPEGDLKEIRARRIAIGEAIREVRDQIPSSKWDKFTTLWKAGLLTAPTTHIRNIAGNIINGGSEKFAQTIGSGFDWMIGKGTGKRTLTRNGFSGMLKGIKEGSGYAKDIMRTGIDTTGEIDSKWRDQRTNYGNGLGGKLAQGYTDFVFNSLNASDKIFRGSAEKMSIANQAKAIAINEKLKGAERKARIEQLINNPTNAMLENAKHDADMATFQQDTGLGQFVAKGRQAGGITKKATDIIMPFTGVPSAVADQLVNYSPLGVVKGVKQVADLRKAVKNGLDDSTITALQRKASTQLGRGITGTMLLGAGLALANAGVLVKIQGAFVAQEVVQNDGMWFARVKRDGIDVWMEP